MNELPEMKFQEMLTRIIDKAVAAAKADYTEVVDQVKLQGSLEGLEACRGKNVGELALLLARARDSSQVAYRVEPINEYAHWQIRSYQVEVEWVCNCVSVALVNSGMEPIVEITYRGVLTMVDLFGVKKVPL